MAEKWWSLAGYSVLHARICDSVAGTLDHRHSGDRSHLAPDVASWLV